MKTIHENTVNKTNTNSYLWAGWIVWYFTLAISSTYTMMYGPAANPLSLFNLFQILGLLASAALGALVYVGFILSRRHISLKALILTITAGHFIAGVLLFTNGNIF